jgi:ribosomal protein S18 acetylase RimI-like enzyme
LKEHDVKVEIDLAEPEDCEAIFDLQRLAYQSEAAIYDDFTIPPLTDPLQAVEDDLRSQEVLKAVLAGRVVGSVRARLEDGTCYIGRLIVHPELQNRGIGTRLMEEIEDRFPSARRYELFTGKLSERNLHLYAKLGYRPFRSEAQTEHVTIVYLEKDAPSGRRRSR